MSSSASIDSTGPPSDVHVRCVKCANGTGKRKRRLG